VGRRRRHAQALPKSGSAAICRRQRLGRPLHPEPESGSKLPHSTRWRAGGRLVNREARGVRRLAGAVGRAGLRPGRLRRRRSGALPDQKREARSEKGEAGRRMPGTRCRMPDARCRMPDAGAPGRHRGAVGGTQDACTTKRAVAPLGAPVSDRLGTPRRLGGAFGFPRSSGGRFAQSRRGRRRSEAHGETPSAARGCAGAVAPYLRRRMVQNRRARRARARRCPGGTLGWRA
jgi:hypothetical protein